MIRVASWGAGVQSTTMIALSVLGILPKLDHVIHCDLGWERAATYAARDYYEEWFLTHGLKVHILFTGNIRQHGSDAHIHMPFWTESGGHLRRQCTRNFKIRPTRRYVRQLLGLDPTLPPNPQPDSVQQWIGISTDERTRARISEVEYIRNLYPLLQLGMSRADCEAYLVDHDLPVPPKSACLGCPYRKASEWLDMRTEAPQEFADACAFDEEIRYHSLDRVANARLYIYRHQVPLAEADLERDAAREKPPAGPNLQLPLFPGAYALEEDDTHVVA